MSNPHTKACIRDGPQHIDVPDVDGRVGWTLVEREAPYTDVQVSLKVEQVYYCPAEGDKSKLVRRVRLGNLELYDKVGTRMGLNTLEQGSLLEDDRQHRVISRVSQPILSFELRRGDKRFVDELH